MIAYAPIRMLAYDHTHLFLFDCIRYKTQR